MNVVVTGSKGFIGRNIVETLKVRKDIRVFELNRASSSEDLLSACGVADLVIHTAGVNRPLTNEGFAEGNYEYARTILGILVEQKRACPLVLTSSTQAKDANPYGLSKKETEDLFVEYSLKTGAPVQIFRLSGVFGKWSRPNYNSVVATFCHNVSRGLPVTINDSQRRIALTYIDDVVSDLTAWIDEIPNQGVSMMSPSVIYEVSLGKIHALLVDFRNSRLSCVLPNISDPFTKKLYSTYLSFLEIGDFSYTLQMKSDNRGSFTEFLKTSMSGQISINISKPGIIKGNHWHHTKVEKFLVVVGCARIRFNNLLDGRMDEYCVDGSELKVIDIPPGYTHTLENIGEGDMITVIWANEIFDPNHTDTFTGAI